MKRGKLKFTLHGEKLKGSWALVRMGGTAGEGGKNWLLIKHRDKAARPDAKSDFLARHARSVVSGRKMEEIAADADRTWKSGKASASEKKSSGKPKMARVKKVAKRTARSTAKKSGRSSAANRGRRRPTSRRPALKADDVASLPGRGPQKFRATSSHNWRLCRPKFRLATTGFTS